MSSVDSAPGIAARSTGPVGERAVYCLVGTQAADYLFHSPFSQLFLFAGQRGEPAQVQLWECLRGDLFDTSVRVA